MEIRDAFDRLMYRLSGQRSYDRQRQGELADLRFLLAKTTLRPDERSIIMAYYTHLSLKSRLTLSVLVARTHLSPTAAHVAATTLVKRKLLIMDGTTFEDTTYQLNREVFETFLLESARLHGH